MSLAVPSLNGLITSLSRARILLRDEASVQRDISSFLSANSILHLREVVLSARDRIDFIVGDIGIEVKLKGSKVTILRQVERYAEHDRISALILISAKTMALPAHINGKPTRVISLGAAWL